MSNTQHEINLLYQRRPKNTFSRVSWLAFFSCLYASWFFIDFSFTEIFRPERLVNLNRFLSEVVPYPLQNTAFSIDIFYEWLKKSVLTNGWIALKVTTYISILSIALAGIVGLALSFFSSRILATSCPFSVPGQRKWELLWAVLRFLTRGTMIFVRAIPEYIWAFIFLSLLGPSALPAVLALAVHNCGILGKLNAELIENLPSKPLAIIRKSGATRSQIALFAVLPSVFNNFLALFFYRFETCVRESTVLGMLGIVSLGYYIEDSRARNHYDDMMFYIILGSFVVIIADFVSTLSRMYLRKRC